MRGVCFFVGIIILSVVNAVNAVEPPPYFGRMYSGTTLTPLTWNQFFKKIPKGAIVLIGEQHNRPSIQNGQMSVLNGLRKYGHKINVGMEFLDFTSQNFIDNYRSGELSEEDFLQNIKWGDVKFEFYKNQILFPNKDLGEKTFGINSPRWLTGEISKKGISGLSQEGLDLIPPNFQIGRASYQKRFADLMSGHVTSPEAMGRYFEAQSVWDETMAWQILNIANSTQDKETLVVTVGQFHIEYGGGLPYQLQVRGLKRPVIVIEQFLYYNDEDIPFEDLKPSLEFGSKADFIMIVRQD